MTAFSGIIWPVRVYYEDTDSGGIVYYANYLKYMERARTEWLRSRGFEQDELIQQLGLIFAVRSAEIEYRQPVRFNQLMGVSVNVSDISKIAITFSQHIIRLPDSQAPMTHVALLQDKQAICCSANIKIASLDAQTLRPKRMPEQFFKELTRVD